MDIVFLNSLPALLTFCLTNTRLQRYTVTVLEKTRNPLNLGTLYYVILSKKKKRTRIVYERAALLARWTSDC